MSASLAITTLEFLKGKLVKGAPPSDFAEKKLDSDMRHRQGAVGEVVTNVHDNDRARKIIAEMGEEDIVVIDV